MNANDRKYAIEFACEVLEEKPVYLDTETTGLGEITEVCDLAVIDHDGTVLLDTLIKPTFAIPHGATQVHGISNSDVAHAPSFCDVLPLLGDALDQRVVIIYNADYDLRILRQSARDHGQELHCHVQPENVYCAMELYAHFYGDWSDYRQSYTWQKLSVAARQCGIGIPATLNRARADAELTRQIILHVANKADAEQKGER